MSFILDALKKSEAERQRQAGPTLLEVRITQPRRRYPPWLIVVTVLLLVNVAVLLVFLFRHPTATAAAPPSVAAVTLNPAANPVSPAPRAAPAVTAPAAPVIAAPPVTASAVATAAAADTGSVTTAASNTADDQPAIERAATSGAPAPHQALDVASLPSFNEVAGNVPELRLDLHVYDDQPSRRYALINMHRVHEGDLLPEGARVLAITNDGVALDYHGQQFMLRPQ